MPLSLNSSWSRTEASLSSSPPVSLLLLFRLRLVQELLLVLLGWKLQLRLLPTLQLLLLLFLCLHT
jgi:hypothetical protein